MGILGKTLKTTIKVAKAAPKIATSKPVKTAFTIGSFIATKKDPVTYVENRVIEEVGSYTYKKSKGIFKDKVLSKTSVTRDISKSKKVGLGVKGVEKLVSLTWGLWFKK